MGCSEAPFAASGTTLQRASFETQKRAPKRVSTPLFNEKRGFGRKPKTRFQNFFSETGFGHFILSGLQIFTFFLFF